MYSKILLALDGSNDSLAGARLALALGRQSGSTVLAAHVFDAGLHSTRLSEMEPYLPLPYQEEREMARIREAHKDLIVEGFEALSRGYMDQFAQDARAQGVEVEQIHREGRNYVKLLEIVEEYRADLIILGANGLADAGDGSLGSTASRVLRLSSCDILLARRSSDLGKILVGVDGSLEALWAVQRALAWARVFDTGLELAAVYDPNFHCRVFNTMADALSPSRQDEVGLVKQRTLHDQLIDQGLEALYEGFLNRAHTQCHEPAVKAEKRLLQGKAYRALVDYAAEREPSLIVVGRYGHHRDDLAQIGSNSEAVAARAKTNVLVVGPAAPAKGVPARASSSMEWDEEARARLKRIPGFARLMAEQGIENHARTKGSRRVTLQDFEDIAEELGMRGRTGPDHE